MNIDRREFVVAFSELSQEINRVVHEKGFWDNGRGNDGEKLMLIVTEIAEGLEGLRRGNPPSEHIPLFNAIEEELADAVIRIMDLSHERGWRVPEAIIAKMAFNESRPRKHGKEF